MCLSKSADATLRAEAIFPDRRIRPEVGVFLILLISSSISFNFLLSPVSLMGPPGASTSDLILGGLQFYLLGLLRGLAEGPEVRPR